MAIYGTFCGYLFTDVDTISLISSGGGIIVIIILKIILILLILASVFSLGRSFGIVPATRGVKTRGAYSIVRHPLYALYIVYDILDIVLLVASWYNMLIFFSFLGATYLRAKYEEDFLMQDAEYQEYTRKTKYMFIPGVF